MIDPEVLKSKKLAERLKAIATAQPPEGHSRVRFKSRFHKNLQEGGANSSIDSDLYRLPEKPTEWDLRQFFERRINARTEAAMQKSLETYQRYAAVDLALDTPLLSGIQIPLQLLAQGYIDVKRCKQMADTTGLSEEWRSQIFEEDDNRNIKVNFPRFWEISHNLVLSLLTRRVAAIGTPIAQRHPFLKYDSRSSSQEGQLRADLMTQRAEIMADDYGYRHDVIQTVRHVSAYGHEVEFLRCAWDEQTQTLRVPKRTDGATGIGNQASDYETKEVIVKEGLDFVAPHPTRVFYDRAEALAKLNTDTGPTYCGYWDIVRFGDIVTSGDYWNTEEIFADSNVFDWLTQGNNRAYWDLYYRDRIAIPAQTSGASGLANDRLANVAYYDGSMDDQPTTLCYYFEKLNPKTLGIADYDHDVWIRFTVAGNQTIVHAEPLACTPAVVYHYNEDDARDECPSFAMQVIPYQDQVNNLLTQLLETQFQGLTKIFALNVEGMQPDDITAVERSIHNKDLYAAKTILLKYSSESLRDMGVDPRTVYAERFKAIEISTAEKTGEIIRSIVQILALAERNLFFSPQELGQVSPRETSATEISAVMNTTLGIRDFHGMGIEEALDAKKRLIYEATTAFGSDDLELPVMNTYSRDVVEKAGFEIIGVEGEEDFRTVKRGRFTVAGNKGSLIHNFIFSSRDGPERETNSQTANAIVQMFDVMGKYQAFQQFLTNEDAISLLNTVSRSLGLPFKAKLPAGVDGGQPVNPAGVQQIMQAIQALGQAVTQQGQQIGGLQQQLAEIAAGPSTQAGEVAPGIPRGAPPLPPTTPPQEVSVGMA